MDNTLDTISIKGFRSIREITDLKLNPINLLVGANGAGKSNFVEIFAFLKSVRSGRMQQYVQIKGGGANAILYFGSKTTPQMGLVLSFSSHDHYAITLNATETDSLEIDHEDIWHSLGAATLQMRVTHREDEAHVSNSERSVQRPVQVVQAHLDGFQVYHFHDTSAQSPLKQTADVNDNRFFRQDGGNLPAFLLFLKEKNPFSYRRICKTVQKVTPFLKDFQLEPLRLNENKIRLEWIHTSSDQYFDVSSLSDGTLRFICLATLLLQPPEERPSIILLDEPELGLHPHAISMLASMIKSAAVDTQVIISTQSSLLLDHFEPEDILVTELEDGATTIKRLQADDLETWLEDYSLGQLWEKNHFGGSPQYG